MYMHSKLLVLYLLEAVMTQTHATLLKNKNEQGLYLYTLIIRHKSNKMLSKLNKLTLQKDLQNIVTNYVFMDKNKTTTTKNKKIKPKNPCIYIFVSFS